MANVVITTKGFRTRLVNTSYFKGKEKYVEVKNLEKKELMRVTNTAQWSGIKYRMPTELANAISVRTGRRSRRPTNLGGRNAGDLKFDIDNFRANELHTIGEPNPS